MNNASIWMRYYQAKIKKTFKDSLKDWVIPIHEGSPHTIGSVEFQLYRPTKRRLDADSIAFIGKWTVDLLVEQGYFVDDDNITFVYKPVIVESDRVETEVMFTVKSE